MPTSRRVYCTAPLVLPKLKPPLCKGQGPRDAPHQRPPCVKGAPRSGGGLTQETEPSLVLTGGRLPPLQGLGKAACDSVGAGACRQPVEAGRRKRRPLQPLIAAFHSLCRGRCPHRPAHRTSCGFVGRGALTPPRLSGVLSYVDGRIVSAPTTVDCDLP